MTARHVVARVVLVGMWLIANQPLPLDGRSHGCERPGAAATQESLVASAQSGCHHTDVACLVVAGCSIVPTALSPTRTTLPGYQPAGRGVDRDVTPIADLFQARPPTPPPND